MYSSEIREFLRNSNHFPRKLLRSYYNPSSFFATQFQLCSMEKSQIIVHLAESRLVVSALEEWDFETKTYFSFALVCADVFCTLMGNLVSIIANVLISLPHRMRETGTKNLVNKDLNTNNKAWNLADKRYAAFVSPLQERQNIPANYCQVTKLKMSAYVVKHHESSEMLCSFFQKQKPL